MACKIILILYINLLLSYFILKIFLKSFVSNFHASPELKFPNPTPHLERNLSLQKFNFNTYFVNFVLFLPFDAWFQLKPRTAFVKSRLWLPYLALRSLQAPLSRQYGCDFCNVWVKKCFTDCWSLFQWICWTCSRSWVASFSDFSTNRANIFCFGFKFC